MLIVEKLKLNEKLRTVLEVALLLHDAGKASSYFQRYMQAICELEKREITEEEFGNLKYELGGKQQHAIISALWTFLVIEELFDDPALTFIGYAIVLKHHGHLGNLDDLVQFDTSRAELMKDINQEINYQELNELIALKSDFPISLSSEEMDTAISDFFNSRKFRRSWKRSVKKVSNSNLWLNISLLYSILLSADKGECIFDGVIYKKESEKLPAQLVDFYKQENFKDAKRNELNQLRNQVYNSVNDQILKVSNGERFFSINVPTGIGKTLTVLNASLKLVKQKRNLEKTIYCLPFTSVIDQNAEVIEKILNANEVESHSENLLINHHLAELKYSPEDAEGEIDDNRGEFLITQFESNINVTTFYQLLHGIYTAKNNEIKKLHSFANSVIILDEVQSIPSKYWPLVKEIFTKIAEQLNIIFIFVTATLPMIFSEEKGEIKELVKDKESVFKSVDRINLDTSLLQGSLTEEQFIEIIEKDIEANPEKSFLIILNTIKSSKNIYQSLRDFYSNLVYLSTNIPPIERLRRIKRIKSSKEPQIVVSTQLVEAGVDIDLDVVYRDLAPLDSIFQSAGRCNRNAGASKGVVKVFCLLDDNDKHFGSYIYSQADLSTTKDLLKEKQIFSEADFFDLGKNYFGRVLKTSNVDDSHFILEQLDQLNYANAFDRTVHDQAFELMEERVTFPAYVAFEKEAKQLIDRYKETIELDFDSPFDKRREIKNILKKLSKYAVSVPEKHSYKEHEDSFYYIISEDWKDFPYDPETGIQFEGGALNI
jgi:CRISPR-associated endonuclease/helicase Cas3